MLHDNIFSCELLPSKDGYTFTIVSQLGPMLHEAERSFGQRNKDYTILGIELADIKQPQIWFPGDCRHIIIQLTEDCINDMDKALFQLAHETIHCLEPNKYGSTTVLEEGLATYFSMNYNGINDDSVIDLEPYKLAYHNVKRLLKYDDMIILKARTLAPNLSLITADMLHRLCPSIDKKLAQELTRMFA